MALGMSRGFRVPPRSCAEISSCAEQIRKLVGLGDIAHINITNVLEFCLPDKFGVGSRGEMGENEGETSPDGEDVRLREDVYHGAAGGNPRDRFTAAHELGHYILHTGPFVMARKPVLGECLKAYEDSEWQADFFAAEFLMPSKFFREDDTEETVMERHGVSRMAARKRLKYVREKGLIPKEKGIGLQPDSLL